jgi:hypothetical protein
MIARIQPRHHASEGGVERVVARWPPGWLHDGRGSRSQVSRGVRTELQGAQACRARGAGASPTVAGDGSDVPTRTTENPRRAKSAETTRTYRIPWAALLQRVFAIDVPACPECSGRMKLIAFIAEARVAKRILDHLGEDSTGRTPGTCAGAAGTARPWPGLRCPGRDLPGLKPRPRRRWMASSPLAPAPPERPCRAAWPLASFHSAGGLEAT